MTDRMQSKNQSLPALNPEQVAVVQPWKSFISRGLISINLKISPLGTNISVEIGQDVDLGTYKGSRKDLPPGKAKEILVSAGLSGRQAGGTKETKEQPLPKRTLCDRDFVGGNLKERVVAVANNLGPGVACGRISSLKMTIDGVGTFEEWWSKANVAYKARLIMDLNQYEKLSEQNIVELEKVLKMKSPFLGSLSAHALYKPGDKVGDKEKTIEKGKGTGSDKKSETAPPKRAPNSASSGSGSSQRKAT